MFAQLKAQPTDLNSGLKLFIQSFYVGLCADGVWIYSVKAYTF